MSVANISTIPVVDNWMSGMPPAQATTFRALYPLMVTLLTQQRSGNSNNNNIRTSRSAGEEPPPKEMNEMLEEYDYIVVGGGSAGSVVASRLSEDPDVTVLLLEAGMDEKDSPLTQIPLMVQFLQQTDIDWQFKTERQDGFCLGLENQRCNWPRGKILGGSSVLNYMIYVRGNRRDYDNWAAMGNPGWDYESVLPYFMKSEDNRNRYRIKDTEFHGKGGPMTVSDLPYKSPLTLSFMASAAEMGYPIRDVNGPEQTGFMLLQSNVRNGRRLSMSRAFLERATGRNNLHIVVNAMVDKVLFDENKRASAVVFEKEGKMHEVKVAREIILSAGSIGTPAILMRSGIGPARHLRSLRIPVIRDSSVGQNLQDHVGVIAFPFLAPRGFGFHYEENREEFMRFLNNGRGPFTSAAVEAVSFLNTKFADPEGVYPDIQFHFIAGGVATDNGRALWKAFGFTKKVWEEYFQPLVGKEHWSVFAVLLRPESAGTITLKSKDFREYPVINPNYFAKRRDIDTLIEGFKLMMKMSNTTAFQKVGSRPYEKPFPGCEQHVLFTDAYFECFARHATSTIYHPVGTAKMGPASDPSAVVDHELRVHGVQGLRVVDASIMPKIVSGNTNAPVVMIAEKASDMIKQSRTTPGLANSNIIR